MRLKMLVGLSGPTICLSPGDEHDFTDNAEAIRLVEAGYAVPAPEAAPVLPASAATMAPVKIERAARRPREKRA